MAENNLEIGLDTSGAVAGLNQMIEGLDKLSPHARDAISGLVNQLERLNTAGGGTLSIENEIRSLVREISHADTLVENFAHTTRKALQDVTKLAGATPFPQGVRTQTQPVATRAIERIGTSASTAGLDRTFVAAIQQAVGRAFNSVASTGATQQRRELLTEFRGNPERDRLLGRASRVADVLPDTTFLRDLEPAVRQAANAMIAMAAQADAASRQLANATRQLEDTSAELSRLRQPAQASTPPQQPPAASAPATRQEPPRQEPPRAEPPRTEPPRNEPPRRILPRLETYEVPAAEVRRGATGNVIADPNQALAHLVQHGPMSADELVAGMAAKGHLFPRDAAEELPLSNPKHFGGNYEGTLWPTSAAMADAGKALQANIDAARSFHTGEFNTAIANRDRVASRGPELVERVREHANELDSLNVLEESIRAQAQEASRAAVAAGVADAEVVASKRELTQAVQKEADAAHSAQQPPAAAPPATPAAGGAGSGEPPRTPPPAAAAPPPEEPPQRRVLPSITLQDALHQVLAERAEFYRQQLRVNAQDPHVTTLSNSSQRYYVDTTESRDRPRIQRRIGEEQLRDLEPRGGEYLRVLGVHEARQRKIIADQLRQGITSQEGIAQQRRNQEHTEGLQSGRLIQLGGARSPYTYDPALATFQHRDAGELSATNPAHFRDRQIADELLTRMVQSAERAASTEATERQKTAESAGRRARNAQYEEDLQQRRTVQLGGERSSYSYRPLTGTYSQRDIGELNPDDPEHARDLRIAQALRRNQLAAAENAAIKDNDAQRRTSAARELEARRAEFESRLQQRNLIQLGGAQSPYSYQPTTGAFVHRDLGELSDTDPAHARDRRIAETLLTNQVERARAAATREAVTRENSAASAERRTRNIQHEEALQQGRTVQVGSERSPYTYRPLTGVYSHRDIGDLDAGDPEHARDLRIARALRNSQLAAAANAATKDDESRRRATAARQTEARQAEFEAGLQQRDLIQLGGSRSPYSYQRSTGEYVHRDLGELSATDPAHARDRRIAEELLTRQVERARDAATREAADREDIAALTRRRLRQTEQEQGLRAGSLIQLGGERSPYNYRPLTGEYRHRDLGVLDDTDPEHARDLRIAQSLRERQAGAAETAAYKEAESRSAALVARAQEATRRDYRDRLALGDLTPIPGTKGQAAYDSTRNSIQHETLGELSNARPEHATPLREAQNALAAELGREADLLHPVEVATRNQTQAQQRYADLLNVLGRDARVTRQGNLITDLRGPTPQHTIVSDATRSARDALPTEVELAASTRRLGDARRDSRQSEAELSKLTKEQARRGVVNNFLAGVSHSGFGDNSPFDGRFDGLARSAGQAVKYNALYTAMGALQQAAAAAGAEFLDMDDSVTELEVVMRGTGEVTAQFSNQLQDLAAIGGFNVGEAMDVAAKGMRTFRDEAKGAGVDLQDVGTAFEAQASRLAVLATTTLTDAAGNLGSIAKGYKLNPTEGGFRQVTDAVAGAKLAGGGDETQIFQGLANSAVTFREMGFSLREAATIISTLNASTDQSGQLLATRVSRLGAILQGESGKKFIRDVNQFRPSGTGAVDVDAAPAQQIGQLAAMYEKMGNAQKQVLTARLGGTAQSREILLLLENYQKIKTLAASTEFDNAGQQEFEKRLQNVRAVLTQIQGNIKAIVTNLALSGVAEPFVLLIRTLKPITDLLREMTQAMTRFAALGGGLVGQFIGVVGPLALILRTVTAIRNAGGIRGALLAAEGQFAPGRAASRLALRDLQSERKEAPVNSRSQGAVARAEGLLARSSIEAVDNRLATAGDELLQAARKLEATEVALRKAVEAERGALKGSPAAVQAGQGVSKARDEHARALAGLDTAESEAGVVEAERNRRAVRDAQIQARRDELSREYVTARAGGRRGRYDFAGFRSARDLESVDARIAARRQIATSPADVQLVELHRERAQILRSLNALELQHQARLRALYAEEEIAEREGAIAARNGRFARRINDFTGGYLNRLRARDPEGTPFYRRTLGSARGGLSGAYGLIGGGAGLALGGTLLAGTAITSFLSAQERVTKAQAEAARVARTAYGSSAEELQAAADEQKAAASALRESTSGFFGGLAARAAGRVVIDPETGEKKEDLNPVQRFLRTLGDAKDGFGLAIGRAISGGDESNPIKEADALDEQARQNERLKAALVRIREGGADVGGVSGLADSLDTTSVDSLTASIKQLRASGYSATEIVAGFSAAVHKLAGTAVTSSDHLTEAARRSLASGIGTRGGNDVADLVQKYGGIQKANDPRTDLGRLPGSAPLAGILDVIDKTIALPLGRDPGLSNLVSKDKSNDAYKSATQNLAAIDRVGTGRIDAIITQTANSFLSEGGRDLTSPATKEAFKKVLTEQLKKATLPDRVVSDITSAVADSFTNEITAQQKALASDPGQALIFAQALPAVGDIVNEDASRAARASARATGNPLDTSGSQGIQAQEGFLTSQMNLLKPVLEAYAAANPSQAGITNAAIEGMQRSIDDAKEKEVQALIAEAREFLALQDRRQTNAARNLPAGTSASEIGKISDSYFTANITKALGTGNVENILGVTDHATLQQRDQATAIANQEVDNAKADYEAQKNRYKDPKEAAERKARNDKKIAAAQEAVKSAQDVLNRGYGSAADLAEARVALQKALDDAQKDGLPNAGRLNRALTARNALNSALGLSGAPHEALEDKLGGTKAERDAAFGAANIASAGNGGLSVARNNLAAANAALAKAKRDFGPLSVQYAQALKSHYEAVNGFNDAIIQNAHIARTSGIDLTNAVTVAREDLRAAEEALADAKARNLDPEVVNQREIDRQQKANQYENNLHSQIIRDASNSEQLGEVSHAAYIGMLSAERDRIQAQLATMKEGSKGYDQLKQELIDTKLKIQQAGKAISGQFNIGEIILPSVYEVRRSLLKVAQTEDPVTTNLLGNPKPSGGLGTLAATPGVPSSDATQRSLQNANAANRAVVNNQTTNTININGADLAKVEAILAKYLSGGARNTTAPRRG